MVSDSIVRVLALCVVLAGVETLHGIARTVLVVPRIGKGRALKLSMISGALLALVVCYLLVPPHRTASQWRSAVARAGRSAVHG